MGVGKSKNNVVAPEVVGLDIDQKFAKALLTLRDLRPFYSTVYESIPHVETKEVDTMGVTGTSLLYNRDFVDKLEFNEFIFTVLHEISHIALLHVPRIGRRDPELWNIACDLYCNKMLAEEFGITPGSTDSTNRVKFRAGGLYCSSIDINIDDSEYIYDILAEQAMRNGFFEAKSGTFHFVVKGRSFWGSEYEFDIDKQCVTLDLLHGSGDSKGKDLEQLENDNKGVLAEASVKNDMLYSGYGDGTVSILQRLTMELLKSKLDWRKLLRKYCIQLTSKDTSYAMPDKRMFYQDAIYPGNRSETELVLERVKICFDRSGSISEKDMQYFYGQVAAILKEFKVTAEIIDWDTTILGRGNSLNSDTKISHAVIMHGGGTSPNCLFQYFDSKECKVKPYVTLIFTDGHFGLNENPRWIKKYKNTIWVMTRDYNKGFEPKIGKLAVAKFID